MSRTPTLSPLRPAVPSRSGATGDDGGGGQSPREGQAATLVIGSLALALVYAALVPLHLAVLAGTARAVMVPLATASCVICGVVWWRTRRPRAHHDARATGAGLLLVCAVPLVNSLTHMTVTAQLEQTTLLMLSMVGVAAIHDRAAQVAGLLAAACLAWGLVVLTVSPGPVEQTGHYAIQLLLASALAAGVFLVRAAVIRRLVDTQEELRRQLVDSDLVRDGAERTAHRFEGIFVDSPVGLGLTDQRDRFVEVNEALCALLGRSRDDLLGRHAGELRHPEDQVGAVEGDLMSRASEDGVVRMEFRYVRPDGEVRWAWLTARHVGGPLGDGHTLAHVQDITGRKEDEEKLRQSREVMRAVVDVAHASQGDGDPRRSVLSTLTTLSRATTASVVEATAPGWLAVTSATDPALVGTAVDLSEPSVTAHVWETGEPLFVSETENHPMVNRRLLDLTGASSMLWQPVLSGEEVIAVLALSWTDGVLEVTDFERQAVATLSAETAIALSADSMRRQLATASITDPLTGLLNRRGWDQAVAELTAQAQRTGTPYTVALLDLDHFKRYNDGHGHLAGDEALVRFAANARAAVREVDLVARWGGEEFVVALRDTGRDDVGPVLERLHGAPPSGLTCSIGYAEVGPTDDLARRLAAADTALFEAKRAGRDRSVAAP